MLTVNSLHMPERKSSGQRRTRRHGRRLRPRSTRLTSRERPSYLKERRESASQRVLLLIIALGGNYCVGVERLVMAPKMEVATV